MADGREHARTSAQELVERLLAEQRAKAARRARKRSDDAEYTAAQDCEIVPVHAGEPGYKDEPLYGDDFVYGGGPFYWDEPVHEGELIYRDEPVDGDEPIRKDDSICEDDPVYKDDSVCKDEPPIKTGAQFVRERRQREERAARSKAAYVNEASSEEDASWRELMAYGTVRRAKGTSSKGGSFGAPAASGGQEASNAPSVTQNGPQMAQNHRYWPNEVPKSEDSPHSFLQDGHSFAGRFDSRSKRVNIDDFVPKPDAAPGHADIASRYEGNAPRHTGGATRAANVPEWRRPAREASWADFALDDESGGCFGVGAGARSVGPAEPVLLPPLLQELRAFEREDAAFLKSRDWLFVRQAKLAADYEDDFEYEGTFQHYFPTYQVMDDRQLRGYFAWRAKARQGQLERTSLSFAFVRLYELLNGVGAATPEEGFESLRDFVVAYRALDSRIERYAHTWLHDYVVYHGLDCSLLDALDGSAHPPAGSARSVDEALAVLVASDAAERPERQALGGDGTFADDASDERLFAALCALSSYHLDAARFYRDEPELTRRAACEVWRALGAHYRKHRKRTLFESLFGRRFEVPYPLFRSAVFYGETRHADAVYVVNPVRRFSCRNGRWTEDAYHEAKSCNKDLGRVMKALDRALRQACGSKHQLKAERVPKYVQDIVDGVVKRLLDDRRQAEERARAVRVEIDFSKLQGIRAAAATTRESLLIDEERSDVPGDDSPAAGARATGCTAAPCAVPATGAAGAEGSAVLVKGAGAASSAGMPHEPSAPSAACALHEVRTPDEAGAPRETCAPREMGAPDKTDVPHETCASGEVHAPRETCAPREAHVPDETQAATFAAPNAAGLTEDEIAYLRCLVEDAPATKRIAVLQRAGVMESLMVDAVNEKLYDMLGDIAVEDAGEGPTIIEDYAEDVKGIAGL